MIISSLNIDNLRNHSQSRLEFSPSLNILTGLNGSGKTTVLEALAICGLSKTFLPTQDAGLIHHGYDEYTLVAHAISNLQSPYRISIRYVRGGRKQIYSSVGDNLSPKDILGEIPMVILSPDYKEITFGAPDDRRRFLDALLSQSGKIYVDDILKLRSILKMRNALLSQARSAGSRPDMALLGIYTDQLIAYGAAVAARRAMFLQEFKPHFIDAYRAVAGSHEDINICYDPDSAEAETLDIQHFTAAYQKAAQALLQDELRRGTTLFGPQKDDLGIFINGGKARETASQGQHKSLLISMKWAEFTYLHQARNEMPVLLFDDIFSELDALRTGHVLARVLESGAQTFITTTEGAKLAESLPANTPYKMFRIEKGQVMV
jgi:DNA replication and repair protein RecF